MAWYKFKKNNERNEYVTISSYGDLGKGPFCLPFGQRWKNCQNCNADERLNALDIWYATKAVLANESIDATKLQVFRSIVGH